MKKTILILGSILILVNFAFAQSKGEKKRLIELPASYGAISIINQPAAPVVIQEAQIFTNELGVFPKIRYLVKNRSTKGIASFTIEFHQKSRVRIWGRYPEGWSETRDTDFEELKPDDTFENLKINTDELEPFTKNVAGILDPKGNTPRLLTLWVGFIKQVTFKDGSKYNTDINGDDLIEILQDN